MKNFKWLFTPVLLFLLILIGVQMGFTEDIQLQVIVQKANVRTKPDLRGEIITQVSLGTILTSDMKEGNWFRVLLPPDENGVRKGASIHNSIVEVISSVKESVPRTDAEKKKVEEKIKVPMKKEVDEKSLVQSLEVVQTGTAWRPRFGLRLLGGGSFFFGRNDLNKFHQASNDYYPEKIANTGNREEVTGEYKSLTTGFNGGIEFFIDILPQISIGIGIGNIQGKKEGMVNWSSDYYRYEEVDTTIQKISAIPLVLSLSFTLPIRNTLQIGIYAGASYYLGRVTYELFEDYMRTDSDFKSYYTETWTAKANSLGFQAGLDFEFPLTRTIALVLRAGGTLVSFSGLTGDLDWTFEENSGFSIEGTYKNQTMWFGEWQRPSTDKWYPDVWFQENQPQDSGVSRNYEEGRVSLTGFGLQIGIKVRIGK